MDNKSHYNQSDQAKSPEKENIKQSENELLRAEAPRASSLVSSDRQKKNIQPGQKNFLIAVLSVLVIILSAIIILSELNICQSIIAKLTNTIQTLQKTMLLLPDKEPEERQEEKFPAPEEQDQETLVPNKESPAPEKETIYFGAIWKDDYSFINISSEEIKEVIPPGYKIVDEYRQEAFPDFFILRKDNHLFSYSLANKSLNKIPLDSLKESEKGRISTSISDKSKFYLEINDIKQAEDKPGYEIVGSRKYFFDANGNQVQNADHINLPGVSDHWGCYKYDSKHSRFFIWPCGGTVPSSLPLTVYNLITKEKEDIVSFRDFGLNEDAGFGTTLVQYSIGYFLTIPLSKDAFPRIIIIDPEKENIIQETFIFPQELMDEAKEESIDSFLFVKEKQTIALGRKNSIFLIRLDSNNQIIDSLYISDKGAYIHSLFSCDNKIYYYSRSAGAIQIINLDNWQKEKSIPITGVEITVIRFE